MSAAPSSRLLGPSFARQNPHPSQPAATPTISTPVAMDASTFNPATTNPPPMGRTDNNSPTYLSSGNPCLDFFFQVVPSTPSATVASLLTAAWRQDPLTALKLVCHLRAVRGTGKSDKESFYSSALWLHQNHPKTLALNASSLASFGYMKDLLEILFRLVAGPDARAAEKAEHDKNKAHGIGRWSRSGVASRISKRRKGGRRAGTITSDIAKFEIDAEKAGSLRRQKRFELATKAMDRYATDAAYKFLHDRIADFFASLLASDLENLRAGNLSKIGLAAKWCPSLDSSFDRYTLLCESIARRMFPKESDPEYKDIEEEHYVYRARSRLRREVLVPLRRALELPEVYMTAGKWDSLPYDRVASVAMSSCQKAFSTHDWQRFQQYLSQVEEGKVKVAAGALLPHDILASVYDCGAVSNVQWRRMVDDLSKKGKFKNSVAVCSVPWSMDGTPMEVSVALGILVSELCEEPWKGRLITFSSEAQLHRIEGETIEEKMEFVTRLDWGTSADLQKVFDGMLRVAVEGKLQPDKMLERVFVFGDMEFDQASKNEWETVQTDYDLIATKFEECGYKAPEIVFWNLKDSRSTPVVSDRKGVAMVSGFSKNLIKIFLEGGDFCSPELVMEAAISGEEYSKLEVSD